MRNAPSRVGAFSIVVLLHVAVFTLSWQRVVPERKAQRYLTLVTIDREPDVRPAESKRATPAREQDLVIRPSRAPAPEPVSPAVSTAITAPPIDWRASMESAASSAAAEIIRKEAHRPLGPVKRSESGSPPSKSIFEQPRRQAGDIDHDATQGRTLIWHNEHCYTELKFPTIKDPNAIVGAPNPPKCMAPIGKQRPRDDLFDDIKKR